MSFLINFHAKNCISLFCLPQNLFLSHLIFSDYKSTVCRVPICSDSNEKFTSQLLRCSQQTKCYVATHVGWVENKRNTVRNVDDVRERGKLKFLHVSTLSHLLRSRPMFHCSCMLWFILEFLWMNRGKKICSESPLNMRLLSNNEMKCWNILSW